MPSRFVDGSQILYVAGRIRMDSSEGMHQDIEERAFIHGEPVQPLQHRCNVRSPGILVMTLALVFCTCCSLVKSDRPCKRELQ